MIRDFLPSPRRSTPALLACVLALGGLLFDAAGAFAQSRARSTPMEPGGAGPSFSITPGPTLEAQRRAPVRAVSIAESDWARNDHAQARLLSGVTTAGLAGDAAALPLGLEFQLAKDWKLYWRTPGDAGYPPRIDWSGSTNLGKAEFDWPVPQRYTIFGLTTYVYQDAVILPLRVTPQTPGEPVLLRGKLEYLLCDKICIPYEGELALDLPAGASEPTDHAKTIAGFAAKVPLVIGDARTETRLVVEHAALTPENGGVMLELLARADRPFGKPDAIVEGPATLSFGAPKEISLSDGGRLALLRLPVGLVGKADAAVPDAPTLTVTLVDGERAIEQDVSAPLSDAHAPARFLAMLAAALLGGLLLNLMPCVLPVLSLKLMGAVRAAGYATRELRLSFLATAGGILVAFLGLAGGAIALKAGGQVVGWGIQFQQPIFLAGMAFVLTLFACSLWGVFAIRLPGGILNAANAACDGKALAGAFFTGVFATLLATPCSAPFLGTAIGFALTRGPGEILAIFAALGLGLAAPYLLVAAVPKLARLLPKPGPWMAWFCRALALVLAVTAFWLLTVLAAQAGLAAAVLCGLLLVGVSAALTLGSAAREKSLLRRAAWPAVGLLAVGLAVVTLSAKPETGPPAMADLHWQPFDRVQIINAVATGKTVLVDVTADWCATCQVNKKLVLDRGDVRAAIASGEVIAMRADWTRPDAAISSYLAGFGRYGIPFNAVYGPAAPSGLVLSELLSEGEVLAALGKAGGAP